MVDQGSFYRCGASLMVLALLGAAPALAQSEPGSNGAPVAATAPSAGAAQAGGQSATKPANAATAEDDGEIVVTGFRGSLARALNLKKEESAATDSILAEDIGKFPDLNLSESIQRIPGVALARDGGEGRQISVRGLGPQFTRVRINGMEALTTAGGADASGGTNRGRSFDFNVFASDLFNAITVRKTAEAETEEGSLGATVDLRTARPFDYKEFTLVASGQASYNDLGKDTTPRGAALISNTWNDGKFGALLSVAYTKRKLDEQGYSTVRWAPATSFAPGFESVLGTTCIPALGTGASGTVVTPAPAACAATNAAIHPRFPRYDLYKESSERIGATASFQWAPTDNTVVSLDGLYADFKARREEIYLEAPSFSAAGACTAATRATTCGIADTNVTAQNITTDNVLIAGTFDDVDLRVEDRQDKLDTKFKQVTLDASQKFGDRFTVNGLIGHSISNHKNPIQTTLTFDQFNVDGYSYDFTNRTHPVFGFGTANLTAPGSFVLTQIRERPQYAKNTYDSAQLSANFDASDAFKLSGGGSYKEYKFNTIELRRSNGTTANQESVIPASVTAVPLANYVKTNSFDGTTFLSPDLNAATSLLNLYDPSIFRLGPEAALGNNNSVRERDKGGFVQAAFNTEIGGVTVRGNAGVRYVETNQRASGFSFVSGAAQAITVDRTYNDWLPAANLVIEPFENFLIRGGAAKVMSRANLGSLVPGVAISVSGANRTVSSGNPQLNPFRAKTYDLSFEYYFQPGALISLALFRKNIDSFVQTLTTTGTFTGNPFGLPDSLAVAACGTTPNCSPSLNNWTFTVPQNTSGGHLKGLEVNYQQPFKFLPSFLSNTGVLLNYTHVTSRQDYLNGAGVVVATGDLTGLSRNSYNATAYYEDSKFSARASLAYRSRYTTRVPGQEAGSLNDGTNATTNVDASIQYTLSEHFKLTLEGINLTDEHQDQYVYDTRNLLSVYHHTGREFLFGVRYTY